MKNQLSKKSILLLSLIGVIIAQPAPAQNGADPYSKNKPAAAPAETRQETGRPAMVTCTYEVFSLPLEVAAAYQREHLADGELYKRLVEGLKSGATRQELLTVHRAVAGQQVASYSILEHIYATEYKGDTLAGTFGVKAPGDSAKDAPEKQDASGKTSPKAEDAAAWKDAPAVRIEGLRAPPLAAAFDTKNLGETIESEPTLVNNELDLLVSFQQDVLVGYTTHGQGISQVAMPEVEVRRFKTKLRVPHGKPTLIGSFNRPTISKVDPESSKRVSYAFVTATAARP